jgi:hypothetical protein
MKNFQQLFETNLGGWPNPVMGTTIAKNASTTTQAKLPHNQAKIEPIDAQKFIASLDDANSKAPKILPFPLDTITDELIYAYGRLQGVESLLTQVIQSNTIMISKEKKLVIHLKNEASRARLIVDQIYQKLCKLVM